MFLFQNSQCSPEDTHSTVLIVEARGKNSFHTGQSVSVRRLPEGAVPAGHHSRAPSRLSQATTTQTRASQREQESSATAQRWPTELADDISVCPSERAKAALVDLMI